MALGVVVEKFLVDRRGNGRVNRRREVVSRVVLSIGCMSLLEEVSGVLYVMLRCQCHLVMLVHITQRNAIYVDDVSMPYFWCGQDWIPARSIKRLIAVDLHDAD